MLVSASGFSWGFFAVPHIAASEILDVGSWITLVPRAPATGRASTIGPGRTASGNNRATAGSSARERASDADTRATSAFMKRKEETCVAPLARSDRTRGACSAVTAAPYADERGASERF